MEFNWCQKTVKKIDKTGGVAQKEGSRQPKSVCTEEKIELSEEMIFSLEDQPGTRFTPLEIACEHNIDC